MRRFVGVTTAVALWAGAARAESPPPRALVAILLDTSGSMGPQDLGIARTVAGSLLQSLPPTSQMAVFTFDDQARLVLPRTTDPTAVARSLEKAKIAGQWTALNDALYDASRYLRDAAAERRAILVLTDGLDENSVLNLEDALAVAEGSRIPIFTVGLGHAQERTLRRIAKLTAGSYASGAQARGGDIAAAIMSLSPASAAPVAASAGAASNPPAPTTPSAQAPAAPREEHRGGRGNRVLLGVGLLIALALVVVLTRKRAPRCAICGRELTDALAPCPFCAEPEAEAGPETQRISLGSSTELPDTIMKRLEGTEEFLERTVTLRESPVLAVLKGAAVGEIYPLSLASPTSLGRAKANDIVLQDVAISSQHCRIRQEEGRFIVHDLRSTNGTFVNDKKVSRCALNEGDTLKLGETWLQFRTDQRRN